MWFDTYGAYRKKEKMEIKRKFEIGDTVLVSNHNEDFIRKFFVCDNKCLYTRGEMYSFRGYLWKLGSYYLKTTRMVLTEKTNDRI